MVIFVEIKPCNNTWSSSPSVYHRYFNTNCHPAFNNWKILTVRLWGAFRQYHSNAIGIARHVFLPFKLQFDQWVWENVNVFTWNAGYASEAFVGCLFEPMVWKLFVWNNNSINVNMKKIRSLPNIHAKHRPPLPTTIIYHIDFHPR